jgi:hypothetical protein
VRFLRRRLVPILIVVGLIIALFVATTGASLPDDGEPIAISPDDALVFARKLTVAAGDATSTKAVSIVVTDEEVTSFLAIASLLSGELQTAGGSGDLSELTSLGDAIPGGNVASVDNWKDLVESQGGIGSVLTRGLDLRVAIQEPEVRFTAEGEVIIRGYGKVAFITVPARLVVKPQIVDGQVEFDLVEGQFGRLPLPGAMSNLAESAIERALLGGYDIASVERIIVSDGTFAFTGQLNR